MRVYKKEAVMKKVYLFLLSLIAYIAIDNLWINFLMKSFYDTQLGALKNMHVSEFQIGLGVCVWALLTLGLCVFAVWGAKSYQEVLLKGALFGAIVYGVYDLTNHVGLIYWPLPLVVVDWAWGICVNAIMAAFIFHTKRWLKIAG